MAASYAAAPRIARSKSGADLLFDRMKQEKYSQGEKIAINYLNSTLEISLSLDHPLHQELQDGVLLCNLVNKLKPGTIKQVGQKDLSFIKMDNITRFLQGARQLGLNSAQLFETIDLFEAKDMTAVIHTILAISRLTEKQILAASNHNNEGVSAVSTNGSNNNNKTKENINYQELSNNHEEKVSSALDKRQQQQQQPSKNNKELNSNSRDNDNDDKEEKSTTKYRDVRDIFGGFNLVGNTENNVKESRLRLNRDAVSAFGKLGHRSTYTAGATPQHANDDDDEGDEYGKHHQSSRTTPSSPTLDSFSRPPKSPLRRPSHNDNEEAAQHPLDMARSLSISSVNSSTISSTNLPKTPKNASYASRKGGSAIKSCLLDDHHDITLEDQQDNVLSTDILKHHYHPPQQQQQRKQNRRLSSPAERTTKRHSTQGSIKKKHHHGKKEEGVATPIIGGSLGHKLDRQYRETANEILAKKPSDEAEDLKEEKLSLSSKDGFSITHYQLGNCIGKGQFGSVYRTLDLATGEIVAVKRLFLEDGLDAEIMKEVALLKTLSHSNVIRYLGFIQSKHSIDIILEFAENGSLLSTLKAFGAFPEKLVASFCIKILNGLEYLHQNQVVHCDLKAANILTTKTGDVKLTDFGVSLNLKIKGADAGSVSGTPNWMAPEVIELKGASTKSDIWSLGCTLVELVTGKPPYADMIAMSAMFHIVEDAFPSLPETISEGMKSFLMACFQKDPELRPSATQLKQHTWILQNQQRIKKTETYSHDLSSYLRNYPPKSIASDDDIEEVEELEAGTESPLADLNHSNMTLRNSSGVHSSGDYNLLKYPNESQMTLFDEDDFDDEYRNKMPLGLRDEEDYITHRFIHTSFGKVVECKVCEELMTTNSIFCEVCALICHEECKKSAFSCPPKVNDQQPSYDWVFSAKIYNRGRKANDTRSSIISNNSCATRKNSLTAPTIAPPVQLRPEDAESIRQYALALGLTPQEEQALKGNQALLSHILSLQQQNKIDPGIMRNKALQHSKTVNKEDKRKRSLHGRRQSEECIIS